VYEALKASDRQEVGKRKEREREREREREIKRHHTLVAYGLIHY
jgi:hypothetical protein